MTVLLACSLHGGWLARAYRRLPCPRRTGWPRAGHWRGGSSGWPTPIPTTPTGSSVTGQTPSAGWRRRWRWSRPGTTTSCLAAHRLGTAARRHVSPARHRPWVHEDPKLLRLYVREAVTWIDTHVRGSANGEDAAVRYYVTGVDQWRDASVWPPPGRVDQRWYLHAGGGLSTAQPSPAPRAAIATIPPVRRQRWAARSPRASFAAARPPSLTPPA